MIFGFATGTAKASPSAAIDDVRDAISIVTDRGGRCERAVGNELGEIKDLLEDESNGRALKRLRKLRSNGASRCPDRVDRLLRSAIETVEHDLDRDHDDDRPAVVKRPGDMPFSDFPKDCQDYWLISELARGRLAESARTTVLTMFKSTCTGEAGDAYYANGTAARMSGNWYYPNGTMARSSSGDFYYPNGTMARSSSGDAYYPNGTMAHSSAGWYYPNGTLAGDGTALVGWGCEHANAQACGAYHHATASDVESWWTFALIRLASGAR